MDQHYLLVCPVNSQNEEKLAGQGEPRLHLLTNATYPRWTCISPFGVRLSEAYTVVPNLRSTIIVRLPEQANSQAQSLLVLVLLLQSIEVVCTILVLGTGWRSVCTLIIFLKCDKAIFNTFGSLRGFSHVIMEVDCMANSPQFSLNSGSYPVTNSSAR